MVYYYIDARKWFKGPKITVDLDELSEEQTQALKDEGLQIDGLEEKTEGEIVTDVIREKQ